MILTRFDLRYVVRSLRRAPFSACLTIGLLAVGLGANAAFFSIVVSFWFRPPVRQMPSTFAQAYASYTKWFRGSERIHAFTTTDYESLLNRNHSFRDLAAWQPLLLRFNATNHGTTGLLVTCNFFSVYGTIRPIVGRSFTAEDCIPGVSQRLILIGEGLWRRSYASDPTIVGTNLRINDKPFTVIGIMPAETSALGEGIDAWVPYTLQPDLIPDKDAFQNGQIAWLTLGGRLRDGSTKQSAAAELEAELQSQDHWYDSRHSTLTLTNGAMINDPDLRAFGIAAVPLIMAPLFIVLLLVSVTVACVFLARITSRRSEIAVRLALGCSRFQVTKLYLLEVLTQGFLAALLGVEIARWLPPIIWHNLVTSDAFTGEIPLSVLVPYILALGIFASIATSILPIRESNRQDLASLLKAFDRTSTIRLPGFDIVIVIQLAACVSLLLGSLTFVHLLHRLSNHDMGFDSAHLMIVPVGRNAQRRVVEEDLQSLPGFVSWAYGTVLPFKSIETTEIRPDGSDKELSVQASEDLVSEGYFKTVGIPIQFGRPFESHDAGKFGRMRPVIISRSLSDRLWNRDNPLNKVLAMPDGTKGLIIAVASDISTEKYGLPDGPRVYVMDERSMQEGQLLVRFVGDPSGMRNTIMASLEKAGNLQTEAPITVNELVDRKAEKIRGLANLTTLTALLGLVIAATGIYGVVAIRTRQRAREIGIRIILGATRLSILLSIARRAFFQISCGLLVGVAVSIPAGLLLKRMTASTPLAVKGVDPRAFLEVVLGLFIITITATCVPAIDALRVDPSETLRGR
jgi:predicted permease